MGNSALSIALTSAWNCAIAHAPTSCSSPTCSRCVCSKPRGKTCSPKPLSQEAKPVALSPSDTLSVGMWLQTVIDGEVTPFKLRPTMMATRSNFTF